MKNIKKEKVNNIRTSLIDKIRLDPFYSNIKSEKHINDGLLFTFESNTVKEIFVPLMEYRIKCFIGFTMNGTSEDSKFLIFKIRISTDPNIKSLLYLESKITSIIEVLTNEENLYKIKKTNLIDPNKIAFVKDIDFDDVHEIRNREQYSVIEGYLNFMDILDSDDEFLDVQITKDDE